MELNPPAPQDRNGFQIAIFCALPMEAENVRSVFDICWEDRDIHYGKAAGDLNTYTTGAIGRYQIVLVHMSSMGSISGALAAACLRSSFQGIKLALVVGICGVVPTHPITGEEITLGDIVISTDVVQYDFGRQYPGGFQRKIDIRDSLSRPNNEVRSFMNMLAVRQNRQRFTTKLQQLIHTKAFRAEVLRNPFPGIEQDRLYEAAYHHQHRSRQQPAEPCEKCLLDVGTCSKSCDELQCEDDKLITRSRHEVGTVRVGQHEEHVPLVHLGRFASACTVMKSGLDRDRISLAEKVAAFEMEGAGIWDQYPTIIIKAACDYADSHKNKRWQGYAASIAAGSLKLFLSEWVMSEPLPIRAELLKPIWCVPFDPMPGFVGRELELRIVEQKLLEPQGLRTVCLLGLGGVGKTRLALEFAFRMRLKFPSQWIFWVQASSQATFENDMLEIGTKLGISGIEDESTDVKTLVKQRLSNSESKWILILDNADDELLWGPPLLPKSNSSQASLAKCLPRTTKGSILITTRSGEVANFLADKDVLELNSMSEDEAVQMFSARLQKPDLAADQNALKTLLDCLAYLPLALVQAASFLNRTQRPIQTYIDLMAKSDISVLKLLSKDFRDQSRYQNAVNPVATTWLITFEHIRQHHPLAASLLARMACFHEKGIPESLLLDHGTQFDEIDLIDALAVLTGYSFVTRQVLTADEELYDMHRLVRLSARNWLKMQGTMLEHTKSSALRLIELFPTVDHEHRPTWTMLLPHTQRLCEDKDCENLPQRYELMELLGNCYMENGKYDSAVEVYTKVTKWRQSLSSSDQQTCIGNYRIGLAYLYTGDFNRATEYLQQDLGRQQERLGQDHPDTWKTMNSLARALLVQGRYSAAGEMYRRAQEKMERTLGPEHPDTLISMNALALLLSHQGNYKAAEQSYRQVIAKQQRILGPEHPDTLETMNNLAFTLSHQSCHEAAEHLQRQVLEKYERTLGPEHPYTLSAMSNLGMILSNGGSYMVAEQLQRQVLEKQERILGPEHPVTLISVGHLASALSMQGSYEAAEQMYRRSVEVEKRVFGIDHIKTLVTMTHQSAALFHQGKLEEAESVQALAVKSIITVYGREHPNRVRALEFLRSIWERQGRNPSETENMLRNLGGS